jgi:hypothetical protein
MKAECAKNAIELHAEIEELATAAVAFYEKFLRPLRAFDDCPSADPTDHELKSAINQTLLNLGRVPDALMAELLTHTREQLKN